MKYEIDFANGAAIERVVTPKGNNIVRRFVLFVDQKGIHIIKRSGIEYLTPDNCEVV